MFVYHFVDPDLRVDLRFKKDGATENTGVDFEIGDIGTSVHWYWKVKKFHWELASAFYYFFGGKSSF